MRRILFVFVSNVEVLAPIIVCTVCSTSKLVGLFSFTMVSVPSPCELNASIVDALKTAPSTPAPMGNVFRIIAAQQVMAITLFGGFELRLVGVKPEGRARDGLVRVSTCLPGLTPER